MEEARGISIFQNGLSKVQASSLQNDELEKLRKFQSSRYNGITNANHMNMISTTAYYNRNLCLHSFYKKTHTHTDTHTHTHTQTHRHTHTHTQHNDI